MATYSSIHRTHLRVGSAPACVLEMVDPPFLAPSNPMERASAPVPVPAYGRIATAVLLATKPSSTPGMHSTGTHPTPPARLSPSRMSLRCKFSQTAAHRKFPTIQRPSVCPTPRQRHLPTLPRNDQPRALLRALQEDLPEDQLGDLQEDLLAIRPVTPHIIQPITPHVIRRIPRHIPRHIPRRTTPRESPHPLQRHGPFQLLPRRYARTTFSKLCALHSK
mmetsp:Transcript_12925/g.36412  ORF Transcript_12925/g.36412 Transcript_12925/m.36412 type:complete len:220 (+) Transcript_12925:633-1292(+)